MYRLGFWALLASLIACASGVGAETVRPLTIAEVLRMESFGAAAISPDEHWVVFERRAPYDSLPRYDLGQRSVWAASRVWIADLKAADAPAPLLSGDEGVTLGGWSPSGRRLLVFRLTERAWEAGVVSLPDRSVRWTGLTPDLPLTGAAFAWRDDDRLLLTTRPDGSLPWPLAYDGQSQVEAADLWREAAAGRLSKVAIEGRDGVLTGRPEAERRLVELDARTGMVRPLSGGVVQDFALSPDGRVIAVLSAGDPVPLARDRVVQTDMAQRSRLVLVDLTTGARTVPADRLDVAPHLLRWSADSGRLLLWARRDGLDWRAGGLASVARSGRVNWFDRGALDPLVAGQTIDQLRGVAADWLGDTPILYARPERGGRFDWFALESGGARAVTEGLRLPPGRLAATPRDAALLVGDGELWRIEAGEAARPVAGRGDYVDATFNDLQKPVRLRSNEPPRRSRVWVEDGGRLRSVEPPAVHDIGPVADGARVVAAEGRTAVILTSRNGGAVLDLLQNGGTRRLAAINMAVAERILSAPRAVDHQDRLDRLVRSWLFPPADRPIGQARGLIVIPYPGALDTGRIQDPFSLVYGVRAGLLASEGFAVLSPSLPIDAADGLSIDEISRGVGLALDAALAAYPDLPTDRIGLLGHSHGGYLVLGMAARSSRYRAVVSWAGMSDLAGEWGEFTPQARTAAAAFSSLRQQSGWIEGAQGEIDSPPYRDPAAYVSASPYYEADRIGVPVLLVTADRDFVPMSQSERLFSAISREGGRVRLATYWGEGHFNWSPENIRDVYREIVGWFDAAFTTTPVATTSDAPRPPSPP